MAVNPQIKPKARERILHLLKTGGPQESVELAESLGVSPMAVRQHLYYFQDQGWVLSEERARPMGRPAKVWMLTREADQFFPDRHNDLLLALIDEIEKTLGPESLRKLLQHRANNQVKDYLKQLDATPALGDKVKHLAKLRSSEGYMAEVQEVGAEGYLLIENHCPICRAAETGIGLCASELEVFRQSLGRAATVERIEHLLSGQRRCVYHIQGP